MKRGLLGVSLVVLAGGLAWGGSYCPFGFGTQIFGVSKHQITPVEFGLVSNWSIQSVRCGNPPFPYSDPCRTTYGMDLYVIPPGQAPRWLAHAGSASPNSDGCGTKPYTLAIGPNGWGVWGPGKYRILYYITDANTGKGVYENECNFSVP